MDFSRAPVTEAGGMPGTRGVARVITIGTAGDAVGAGGAVDVSSTKEICVGWCWR